MSLELDLMEALEAGAEARAIACLQAGADPNADDGLGSTALWLSCHNKLPQAARALLAAGADPALDQDGLAPPLPEAAAMGDAELCLLLIERGARIDWPGCLNMSPLMQALMAGHAALVPLLVAHGADLSLPDGRGNPPLWRAAVRDDPALAEALLALGVAVDARNEQGETALHCAARRHADPAFAAVLVAAGADLEARTHAGQTPQQLAQEHDNPRLATWLGKQRRARREELV